MRFGRVGMIARWRPVHRGHASVLHGLCRESERVLIGIGSSNRHDLRNPFTAAEAADMIRLVLGESEDCTIDEIPDLDDGPRWRAMVVDRWGALDAFVTDNPYVAHLLGQDYRIVKPVAFVPEPERVAIDGTRVRQAMARGEAWQALVPPAVAAYLEARGLDARFRREFGLATLAELGGEHVLMGRGHQ